MYWSIRSALRSNRTRQTSELAALHQYPTDILFILFPIYVLARYTFDERGEIGEPGVERVVDGAYIYLRRACECKRDGAQVDGNAPEQCRGGGGVVYTADW